jgi:DNA-binding NarL/FixJ family response regulator
MITMDFARAHAHCSRPMGSRCSARRLTGESAVEAARSLRPEVVLLDIQLPGLDGFAVAERLAAGAEPPVVVLISSRGEHTYRRRLAGSPARGFISKDEFSGECLASLLV